MSDLFWAGLGMALVFEGLLPFVAPGLWRRLFTQMLQLQDGQLRFFGLISLASGLLTWWLLA